MSDEALNDLINYRLEQAEEALAEGHLLSEQCYCRGAVNRAYYSMFYAIQALLATRDLKTSKHTGAISLFDREFVKTQIFDKNFSRWLHELFDLRQDADYGDMFLATEEQSKQALKHAGMFIKEVKLFLAK